MRRGQKAHDVLIEAFAKAFEGDPDCILVMVGDGPSRQEAETLVQSLDIKGVTFFLGQQPEPWIALKAADVFCFPSRYEGLPNVLLEAASCELPVVASDIPEIRDLCPGDAWLLRLVDDIHAFALALRRIHEKNVDFSVKAREVATEFTEKYSMKTCARKYLEPMRQRLFTIANNPSSWKHSGGRQASWLNSVVIERTY